MLAPELDESWRLFVSLGCGKAYPKVNIKIKGCSCNRRHIHSWPGGEGTSMGRRWERAGQSHKCHLFDMTVFQVL